MQEQNNKICVVILTGGLSSRMGGGIKSLEKFNDDEVLPFKTTDYIIFMKRNGTNKMTKFNNTFIMVFPIINSLFYAIYFYLTLN